MIAGQFDVVFRGQIVKAFELEEVKNNLVKLFKSSPEAVDKLFSGSEVAIKKSLDYTTAMKYQSALKKAGALALIKEVESDTSEDSVASQANTQVETPKPRAQFGQPASFTDVSENPPPTNATDQSLNPEPSEENTQNHLQNEPVESLEPKQEAAPSQQNDDTSLEESHLVQQPGSDEQLTVAEVGAQILPDKVYEKREVDTSDLSLAAAGERILPETQPDEPPPPSTEHLSLVED